MPVSISTPSSNLGRHVFGAAALAFSLITLAWHDYNGWHLPRYIVLPRRRCRDLRRSCDSVPADHENGRSRPWCGLSCLRLTMRATNLRPTADLQ